jgi:hypothetical protein
MPRVIDYIDVQQQMQADGLVSLYHNSGAFGFTPGTDVQTVGWIGADDPTIRDAARALVRQVQPPFEPTLARLLTQLWQSHLIGTAWLMPKSHWHYELHFGNRELLEPLLSELGIDPNELVDRNDGSAIEFSASEGELVREAAQRLLADLRGSDFMIAFPARATLCTIHHHKQLWWQTSNPIAATALRFD